MSAVRAIRWESWALAEEADRRFRRIVVLCAIPALALAILLSLIKFELAPPASGNYQPQRYVELLPQQPAGVPTQQPEQPKPAPKNQEQPPQKAAPAKPVPQPVKPQESAREVAQKTEQMRVIQDQLADLRDQKLAALNDQPLVASTLSSKGGVGASELASSLAASAANASSGLGGLGNASVTSQQSGTGLGSRRTGVVQSKLNTGGGERLGANGRAAGRTLEEIQEVFDRNKGSFNAIYNRAMRTNANIGDGKIVVKITIAPDGSVTECSLVHSTFNDPDFERKIIARIQLLHFAAKAVPPFTLSSYPIEFHPM
jgi:TonB family protein